MCVVNSESDEIIILTSNGYGKRTSVEAFKTKGRNGKGVKFMNLTGKNGIPGPHGQLQDLHQFHLG